MLTSIVGTATLNSQDIETGTVTSDELTEALKDIAVKQILCKRVLDPFVKAFTQVEEAGGVGTDIVVDTSTYELLLKYCSHDKFDVNTHREFTRYGMIGTLFGAHVWVSDDADRIYVFSEQSQTQLMKQFPKIGAVKARWADNREGMHDQ